MGTTKKRESDPTTPLVRNAPVLWTKQPGKIAYCGFFTGIARLGEEIYGVVKAVIAENLLPRQMYQIYVGLNKGTMHVIVEIQPSDDHDTVIACLKRECETRLNLRLADYPMPSVQEYDRFCAFVAYMHG